MTESTKLVFNPSGIPVGHAFVPIDYVMDPTKEDLIHGSELKEGMIVLVEDPMLRDDPSDLDTEGVRPYTIRRIHEASRWCMVTKLRPGQILKFIGVYGDGTKMSRQYSSSYCWLVKL